MDSETGYRGDREIRNSARIRTFTTGSRLLIESTKAGIMNDEQMASIRLVMVSLTKLSTAAEKQGDIGLAVVLSTLAVKLSNVLLDNVDSGRR